jgi:hypothetical protein
MSSRRAPRARGAVYDVWVVDPSTIYFPLRSNAASLITGRGIGEVRRRLMLASLLHDELWIEAGLLSVTAGSDGSNSWHTRGLDPATVRWQSPRSRHRGEGIEFGVAFGIEATPGVAVPATHAMPMGTSSISWEATFEPFRTELPPQAAEWISYVDYPDPPAAKQLAGRWSFSEFSHPSPQLTRRWPGEFVRDTYVKGTHLDIAAADVAGAVVSIDVAHRPVLDALISAGVANRVPGDRLLDLIVPTGMNWSDVVELRGQDRALREYRAAIRAAESAVIGAATLGPAIERDLLEEWGRRIGAAAERRPPRWVRRAVVGLGFVGGLGVGAATATAPPVVGVAGAAVAELASEAVEEVLDRRAKPRWLAVDARIRRRPTT